MFNFWPQKPVAKTFFSPIAIGRNEIGLGPAQIKDPKFSTYDLKMALDCL